MLLTSLGRALCRALFSVIGGISPGQKRENPLGEHGETGTYIHTYVRSLPAAFCIPAASDGFITERDVSSERFLERDARLLTILSFVRPYLSVTVERVSHKHSTNAR